MIDPKRLLDEFLGAREPGRNSSTKDYADRVTGFAKDNPLAAGAIVAALLGTGTGRKLTKQALKLGGMAAIAGLAYKAYQNYQNGKTPGDAASDKETNLLPPLEGTGFHPAQAPQGESEFAFALVRAMIAAARADGHIDEEERRRIAARLKESGLDREGEAFLMSELEKPLDIDALVAAAKTDAQKVELYTASRLAIEPKSRAERGYLNMLAGRLKLPDTLVDHIEATVSESTA
ncbi:tellurite resistance TerB family protein [Chelativorans sp. SCAU2101]|uniref:Tellurite resistance TerB family protein n=1 Tax=Chelativorans petroleitrophicus TaxID=2975484 RepID=A0A9X2XC21_9HYPH|nr:tellurite resistance TerB family protein [Chelativorans petroleitrophicus]MCT8992071.1 tellurite resistance TerB family protein [Chelativorans petroleitrophicus]